MASNGVQRRGLLTAGGILSIVAGVSQLILGGVLIVDFLVSYQHCLRLIRVLFLPLIPYYWRLDILWGSGFIPSYVPVQWVIVGGCIGVLGILAVVGGVSAIRRKSFGLSLAGAICALASGLWGILAVIFVALGKREFGAIGRKMASNGVQRHELLVTGGIFSIVAGISQVICSDVLIVDFLVSFQHCMGLIYMLLLPFFPGPWQHYILWGDGPIPLCLSYVPVRWAIIGGCIGALGILAIVGGISAIRKKRFGLSLAGAICALASGLWGILAVLAVIFVALGKREFGAERKENGI